MPTELLCKCFGVHGKMRKTCSYKAFFSFHGRVQADTGREHILLTKKVEKAKVHRPTRRRESANRSSRRPSVKFRTYIIYLNVTLAPQRQWRDKMTADVYNNNILTYSIITYNHHRQSVVAFARTDSA